MNEKRLLVIGAHSADFVWRAAGAIASITTTGGSAWVVALTYGERGESGELWKSPDQTVENVKNIRLAEAQSAAAAVGASFQCLDLGDYPLLISDVALDTLVRLFQEVRPTILLTHTERDPFNPDHPAAHLAALKARLLSTGAGVASAFQSIHPPDLYYFEPHQPELCEFAPNTYLDITPVMEQKLLAMEAMQAQSYLKDNYTELARRRANHARRISGNKEIEYAEAFQRALPRAVTGL